MREGLDFSMLYILLDGLNFYLVLIHGHLSRTILSFLVKHQWPRNNRLSHSHCLLLISLNGTFVVLIGVQRLEVHIIISLNLLFNRLLNITFLCFFLGTFQITDLFLMLVLLELNQLLLLLDLSLKFTNTLFLTLNLNHLVIIRQLLHNVLDRLIIKGFFERLQHALTLNEVFDELVL